VPSIWLKPQCLEGYFHGKVKNNALSIKNGRATPKRYDDEFDNSSILDQNSTSREQEDLGGGGNLTEDDLGDVNDEVDELSNYGYEDTNRQCTTAVSKLQIRLNNLINQHKVFT
jgi:hypothetical protein